MLLILFVYLFGKLTGSTSAGFVMLTRPMSDNLWSQYTEQWFLSSEHRTQLCLPQIFPMKIQKWILLDTFLDENSRAIMCYYRYTPPHKSIVDNLDISEQLHREGFEFAIAFHDHFHLQNTSLPKKLMIRFTTVGFLMPQPSAIISRHLPGGYVTHETYIDLYSVQSTCEPLWAKAAKLIQGLNETNKLRILNVHKIEFNMPVDVKRYTCIHGYSIARVPTGFCDRIESGKHGPLRNASIVCDEPSKLLEPRRSEIYLSANVTSPVDLPMESDIRQMMLNEFLFNSNDSCNDVIDLANYKKIAQPFANDKYVVILTKRSASSDVSGLSDVRTCQSILDRMEGGEIACRGPFDHKTDTSLCQFQLFIPKNLDQMIRPLGVPFGMGLLRKISKAVHTGLRGCQFSVRFAKVDEMKGLLNLGIPELQQPDK